MADPDLAYRGKGDGVHDSFFSLCFSMNRFLEAIFGDRLGEICKDGSFTSYFESSSFNLF